MSEYAYNVEIDVAGVTFTGPGMENKKQAMVLAGNLNEHYEVQDVRVVKDD